MDPGMGASQSDATYAGVTNEDLRRVAGTESFAFDDPIWVRETRHPKPDPPSSALMASGLAEHGEAGCRCPTRERLSFRAFPNVLFHHLERRESAHLQLGVRFPQ